LSPEVKGLIKYRNAHGLPGRLPMESAPTRAIHIICPGVRETEFPLVIPRSVRTHRLGQSPIKDSDPDLNRWLNRGKTVLMRMGTHFFYSESQVKAVIDGFLSAVPDSSNVQFPLGGFG
jgi:hypothetical protein